jgi:hypothetical protein
MGSRLRRITVRVAIAVFVLAVLVAGCAAFLLRDPRPRFAERRSTLRSVVDGEVTTEQGYTIASVRVTATSGLSVDLAVRRAVADSARRLPLAIILGGHRTGRDAARLVGDTRGLTVAALSYPYDGKGSPSVMDVVRDIPNIRGAFLDTPPAVLLALDYLLRRPDVDTTRVEAVGVSLGVPFMTVAAALDPRITRVWLLHGTGGSYTPLEMNLRRSIKVAPLRILAAVAANVLIAGPRLDPAKWAPQIAPRPLVMVNASGDERLPRASVEALYQSAREPKELVWMEGLHVRADGATISRLVALVMGRIRVIE